MKRGTDHNWEIVKYKGDIALYAKCRCGYHYCCSSSLKNEDGTWSMKQIVDDRKIFPYCPICGARKKTYSHDIKKFDKYSFEKT